MSVEKPVCLVTGVGPGTGAAICRRFASGGFRVAMLARDLERLQKLEAELPGARAYPVDVTDAAALGSVYASIRAELGEPSVAVVNATRGTFGSFLEIDPEDLEKNFRVNVLGLLHTAKLVAPAMIRAGEGSILVTGNTSAHRGKANFSAFAPTKAAQRILAESIARTLGPQGVHVAYVVIDAVIDVPWTRRAFADREDESFAQPAAIADSIWHLAHQDRSAWSFEIDLRPFGEDW
jgi:NAD(P)-dependent dehydrogenase (short-subunit alcohol dehydrogenase family)